MVKPVSQMTEPPVEEQKPGMARGAGPTGHDMLNGEVRDTLLRLAGPMVLAMMAMVAFNLVDTMYVSWLGSKDLAAMTFTFPVIFFYAGISAGIGVGASSVIARKLGAGRHREAELLSADALILSLSIAVILSTIGYLTMDTLFLRLGAEDDILPKVKGYMRIWYLGVVVVVVPMVGNSIIRATGDTKTPMKIMLAAVVVNMVLDPILIFGLGPAPKMGLEGAAWATVAARLTAMVVTIRVLVYQKKLLGWEPRSFKKILESWKTILHVGAPTAAVNVMVPASQAIITALVAVYGTEVVAGYGAASRMEALVLMPLMALSATLVPFVGQNMGAKKLDRVQEAVKLSFQFTIILGILAFSVLAFTGAYTGKVFQLDSQELETYQDYLRYAGFGWLLLGGCYIGSNSFNAMGKPLPATILTLIRMFGLMIPLAYAGSLVMDSKGIFLGIALGNMIGGVLAMVWLERVLPGEKGHLFHQAFVKFGKE